MLRHLLVLTICSTLAVGPAATAAQAPTVFKKLDFYVQEGDEMEDHDAQFIIDAQRRLFIFADEDRASEVFAVVPWDRITGVTYENSKHARITAGLLIAWPMLFLSGKKHWLTFTYGPGSDGSPGGYAFARMDKDNFQTILAAINGYTGYEIRRIEENGEISVLYPGTSTAAQTSPSPASATFPQPAAGAQPASAPASNAAPADNTVRAGALPPANTDAIPAGPLPPPAAPEITPPELTSKGVQWTERTDTAVRFVWAAELNNRNQVPVDATVVLRLFDPRGNTLHEARQSINVAAENVAAFTAEGEVPEADALRADHWEFDVEMPPPGDPVLPAASPPYEAQPSPAPTNVGRATQPPVALIEPVPLTDDMVEPRLVPETVTVVSDNPALASIHFEQTRITIRCLIRADGTVADARVFRIEPPITTDATDTGLKDAIVQSAITHWRFSPAQKNGVAVPVWHMLTVEYTSGRSSLPN